jgi:hypothetical protein
MLTYAHVCLALLVALLESVSRCEAFHLRGGARALSSGGWGSTVTLALWKVTRTDDAAGGGCMRAAGGGASVFVLDY